MQEEDGDRTTSIYDEESSQFELIHSSTWAKRMSDGEEAQCAIAARNGQTIFCWQDADSYLSSAPFSS
eukprot:435603-Pyramimonas_sp.AAC.1